LGDWLYRDRATDRNQYSHWETGYTGTELQTGVNIPIGRLVIQGQSYKQESILPLGDWLYRYKATDRSQYSHWETGYTGTELQIGVNIPIGRLVVPSGTELQTGVNIPIGRLVVPSGTELKTGVNIPIGRLVVQGQSYRQHLTFPLGGLPFFKGTVS